MGKHEEMTLGTLHHIELRTRTFETAVPSWQWLLESLGYEQDRQWRGGVSWRHGPMYLVLEQTQHPADHDRRGAGLNHLAFHAGSRWEVDRLWFAALSNGWTRLYEDRWPWAGGPDHYAAFLENEERFKVELVADTTR